MQRLHHIPEPANNTHIRSWFCYPVIMLLAALSPSISASAENNYFTYIGGEFNESTYDSALDNAGNLFIVGQTHSMALRGINTQFDATNRDQNCFIAKINVETPSLNKATIFGGNGNEVCRNILIGPQQSLYIIGETQSNNFSVTDNSSLKGNWDGFLVKMDNELNLLYAGYIGGMNTDFAHGMAFFQQDKLVIVGETWSTDFPTTSNAYIEDCLLLDICDQIHANSFLQILDIVNLQIVYSSYLGGSNNDKAHAVTTLQNKIVVVGETQSNDFPLINQLSNSLKGNLDGFVSSFEFSSNQTADLMFSSYLGGNGEDSGLLVKIDSLQHIIIAGQTSSDDFPTSSTAFSQHCANGIEFCVNQNKKHNDVFISRIDTRDYSINYASVFGGSKNETVSSLLITKDNTWWITGFTASENLPVTDNAINSQCAFETSCVTDKDGFLLALNPAKSGKEGLQYSSYFGGKGNDQLKKVILYNEQLLLTGDSNSANLSSSTAFNNQFESGDSLFSVQAIPATGNYVEVTQDKKQTQSVKGSLNLIILVCYCLILLSIRRVYQHI